jgi:hypothetical protein
VAGSPGVIVCAGIVFPSPCWSMNETVNNWRSATAAPPKQETLDFGMTIAPISGCARRAYPTPRAADERPG